MTFRVVIVTLMLIVTISSCSKEPSKENAGLGRETVRKYYYPDGKLYLEVSFDDSLANGPMRVYYKTGQVQNESHYLKGIRHGVEKTYYEGGQLSTVTPYDSGRIHGLRKKFRRDGITAYEAPYHYGKPCVGLKEFFLSGQPVNNYPKVVVKYSDELLTANKYTVQVSLSDNAKSVEFFQGQLTGDKYIGQGAYPLPVSRGAGYIYYFVPAGSVEKQTTNVIAKIKTDLGNYHITQLSLDVVIDNRQSSK